MHAILMYVILLIVILMHVILSKMFQKLLPQKIDYKNCSLKKYIMKFPFENTLSELLSEEKLLKFSSICLFNFSVNLHSFKNNC